MAARTVGISGLAVSLAGTGGLLVWSALVNRPTVAGLRDILQGRPPGSSGAPTGPALAEVRTPLDLGAAAGAGSSGSVPPGGKRTPATTAAVDQFLSIVRAQLGKPYRWATAGPDTFDCSGLVTYGLKGAGLDDRRRITTGYLVWSGAVTIPRDQTGPGDLVCWTGHIGVAIGSTEMIHAPGTGRPVQVGRIWSTPPPTIRRIIVANPSGTGRTQSAG
jgi:cell wall-associated NlpC family hydrolase